MREQVERPVRRRLDSAGKVNYENAPWMCARCGYMMDNCSPIAEDTGAPDANSMALCLNCVAPYVWADDRWVPMAKETLAELPDETKETILAAHVARALSGFGDLTKRDRNA